MRHSLSVYGSADHTSYCPSPSVAPAHRFDQVITWRSGSSAEVPVICHRNDERTYGVTSV